MTTDTANQIYDVLVRECEAPEDMRQRFVWEFTKPSHTTEYRFIGSLGFGGKFRSRDGRIYVDCYPEDETPERLAAIERANVALKEVMPSESL